jgi:hypothetical protein
MHFQCSHFGPFSINFGTNDSVLVDPTPSSDAQILGEQFAQTPLDAIEI